MKTLKDHLKAWAHFAEKHYSSGEDWLKEMNEEWDCAMELIDKMESDGPGTPRGRLNFIDDYAVEHCGLSPLDSSKTGEWAVIEALEASEAKIAELKKMIDERERGDVTPELVPAERGHWTREPPTKEGWYKVCRFFGELGIDRFHVIEYVRVIFDDRTDYSMWSVWRWSEPERLPDPPKEGK